MNQVTIKQINKSEVAIALQQYKGKFDLLNDLCNTYVLYKRLSDKQWLAAAKCLKVPSYLKASGGSKTSKVIATNPLEKWILGYTGKFTFVLSLKDQLEQGRTLSPKQLNGAKKCMEADLKHKANYNSKATNFQKEELEGLNADVVLKRYLARSIKKDYKLDFTPITMTITKFHGQTKKAINLTGMLTEGDVDCCRCCGKSLTDERSKATGVGPICAKNLGIKYVTNKQDIVRWKKELKEKIKEIGEMTFWAPKSQIKEGEENLRRQIIEARK